MSRRLGRLGRLGRWLLGLWLCLLLLGLGWLVAVWTDWLPRPTAEEIAAQQALAGPQTQVSGQRNAFGWLLFADYPVPVDQIDGLLAAELERLASSPTARTDPSNPLDPLWRAEDSPALAAFTRLPALPSADWLCGSHDDSCLQRVREHADVVRAELEVHVPRLAHEQSLQQYDYLRIPEEFPGPPPFGALQSLGRLPLTASALAQVDGRTAEALALLCRQASVWRRLQANSDQLIVQMAAAARFRAGAKLRAEIAAEAPQIDDPACEQAFALLNDEELRLCPAMAQEYRFQAGMSELLNANVASELGGKWLFNEVHFRARIALPLGHYCLPAHAERIRTRQPSSPPSARCSYSQALFNPVGCTLAAVASPDWDRWHRRLLDNDAALKLLASADWLRHQAPAGDRAEALARLPQALRSSSHVYTLVDEGRAIRTTLLDPARGKHWTIPIDPPLP